MNQYIITDEELQQLLTRQRKNSLSWGSGSEFSSLLDWEIAAIVDEVYYRLYNPQAEREKMLEALKKDLQTRFISSGNQWSRGRNSGLNECYNIIDELFHQIKEW